MLLRALNRLPEDEKRAAAERVYREAMAPFGKEIEADEPASLLDGQATRDTEIFKVSFDAFGSDYHPPVRIDGRPACAQFLGEAGSRGC